MQILADKEAIILISPKIRLAICGLCAGSVTGLLGAGGGMILVPMLSAFTDLDEDSVFPSSVAIILPLCIISLFCVMPIPAGIFRQAIPYLIGSGLGGIISALIGKKLPTKWLHRILGGLILWGGLRYLC